MSIDEQYQDFVCKPGCLICVPDASTGRESVLLGFMWYALLSLALIGLGAVLALIWEVV